MSRSRYAGRVAAVPCAFHARPLTSRTVTHGRPSRGEGPNVADRCRPIPSSQVRTPGTEALIAAACALSAERAIQKGRMPRSAEVLDDGAASRIAVCRLLGSPSNTCSVQVKCSHTSLGS